MMGGFGMGVGMGWLGILTMTLFWIAVVLLIVWGLSSLFPARISPTAPDAREILRQRFARGEISYEEFEQARQVLEH